MAFLCLKSASSLDKGERGGSFKATSIKLGKFFFWEGDKRRGVKWEGAGEKLELAPSHPSPNPLKKKLCEKSLIKIKETQSGSKVSLSIGPKNMSHVGNVGACGVGRGQGPISGLDLSSGSNRTSQEAWAILPHLEVTRDCLPF